jgi:ribosomal protein S18 acetylase RimI-like enzyme
MPEGEMTERDDLLIRPLAADDVDALGEISLRAWAPVHQSMADVLGRRLNQLVYPDWRASQEADLRQACTDESVSVTAAADRTQRLLGFVSVVIRNAVEGEIDMIAVDPGRQRNGVGRVLMEHGVNEIRAAGCRFASVATGETRFTSRHGPCTNRAVLRLCRCAFLPRVVNQSRA